MLSIGAMGHGQGSYYLDLAREDYYLAGGEPPGRWLGRGAADLGLAGLVEREALERLLEGFAANAERALIQNAGAENHQPGWDLTFSAPKSVSVIWSQADESLRHQIQAAHDAAVKAAIAYLETNAGITRRGKSGFDREAAGLIVALFEHGTSRALDPQLHTHALILNVATRDDGTTGTLESKPLYEHKMAAGALYRAELAAQLERLGLAVERHSNLFEVKEVPQALITEFSKRRQAIEATLQEHGWESAAAAAIVALHTREVKQHVAREQLFESWREVGQARGFSLEEVNRLRQEPAPPQDPESTRHQLLETAIAEITFQNSFFTPKELVRRVAEQAPGTGMDAAAIQEAVREHLSQSPEIVSLGVQRNTAYYTTREMLALEEKMLAHVEASRQDISHLLREETLAQVLAERPSIRPEQADALEQITRHAGSVQGVSGMAGTGKTFLLAAAREAWEREGYTVLGMALQGKAAQGLEESAGIVSATLHKRLADIQEGKLKLDTHTVLVVDEAGMIGTRQMEALLAARARSGCKLVLVGDARQLQPIEAGGAFRAVAERVEAAPLKEITRQDQDWARLAVHQFADGRAKEALQAYAERGLLHVEEDRKGARQALVTHWREGGVESPRDHLILTGTRLETAILNRMAQEERRRAGELGTDSLSLQGDTVYQGDRVLFTRNSRLYGVKNGSLGTVTEVDPEERSLRVRLDNGARTTIDLQHYEHLQLGYAITTHKGQGITVENAYILAGGAMQDRELSYVQASRARGETRIFTDRLEAGEKLTALAQQMSVSHQKRLASDIEVKSPTRRTGLGIPALSP